jgi:hypothetical protein
MGEENEVWKKVAGYEDLYWVSNLGQVKSSSGILNQYKNWFRGNHPDNKKYRPFVSLCKNGKKKDLKVSRLVAQAFVPNPKKKPQVRHKDLDPTNTRWDNLMWVTEKEGARYASKKGAWHVVPNEKLYLTVKKKIIQYDLEGNEKASFTGIAKAARETGIDRTNINHCLQGRQLTAGSCVWKYEKK